MGASQQYIAEMVHIIQPSLILAQFVVHGEGKLSPEMTRVLQVLTKKHW